jgi:hypothetical protein
VAGCIEFDPAGAKLRLAAKDANSSGRICEMACVAREKFDRLRLQCQTLAFLNTCLVALVATGSPVQ